MIIAKFKRKTMITAICLIIIGLIISVVGFAMEGFDINNLNTASMPGFFRTINIDKGIFSFSLNSLN